jgi:branched-chain amino acid transport system substrate-binding protein
MKKLLPFFICLAFITTISAQQTLKELNFYAKDNIEYTTYDNNDLLNPDYTTFHKSQIKGFFGKAWDGLLRLVRIKNKPVGTIDILKKLLDKLSKDKKQGDFIYKFTPKSGEKFVIWGALHGAFHSFTRDLEELKELKIIDEDLKIAEGYYFVFNGNVIDRSPYIIETLCVVLSLIEKNPDKVFYLRGDHEDKEKWHTEGLKREFTVKGALLSKENLNCLIKKVDYYFNTLPIALFLKTTGQDEFVCCSHYGLEENNLKQSIFADFLAKDNSEQLKTFNLMRAEKTNNFVNIESIIKGSGEQDTKVSSKGLTVLLPDHGATAWRVLSSPTISSQKNYSFFDDSFVIVEVGKDIYNWKISSYYQDVRTKKGFEYKSYYLVSTQSTDKPACDGKIVIGSTMDLSAGINILCRKMFQGLFLPILNQNKKRGINGKYLKLIVLDDKYNSEISKKNIQLLLNRYKTDILLAPVGSPTLNSYINLVKTKKILVLFPLTGSDEFRVPGLANVIHFRASYSDESRALMEYAIKDLNLLDFVFFYPNDLYGLSCLNDAKEVLKKDKKFKFIQVDYLGGSTNIDAASNKIAKSESDALVLFSTPLVVIELLRQLKPESLSTIKLLGNSILSGVELKKIIKQKGLNITVTQVFPDANSSQIQIVKEYRKASQKNNFSFNTWSLEGYINSSIFIDILKKIKGEITKEKIIQKMEKIKNYNLEGLKLNFNPQTKSLSDNIWVVTEKNEWIRWKGDK